jgi:hypothetical protein
MTFEQRVADVATSTREVQHMLQALAVTQREHTAALDEISSMLGGHTSALTGLHAKVGQILGMVEELTRRTGRER